MKTFRVTPKYIKASYYLEKDGYQYVVLDEFENILETFIDLESAKSWMEAQNLKMRKKKQPEPEIHEYEFILPNEDNLSLYVNAYSKSEAADKMRMIAKENHYKLAGVYLKE